MATLASETRVGRKKKEIPTTSVRLPDDVVVSARVISSLTGEPIVDVMSSILRPALSKREKEELARRSKRLESGK